MCVLGKKKKKSGVHLAGCLSRGQGEGHGRIKKKTVKVKGTVRLNPHVWTIPHFTAADFSGVFWESGSA